MKTFLGQPILPKTRAVLYLCDYNCVERTMKVCIEIQFEKPFEALQAYANVPNPESQMASGKDKAAFEKELIALHANLNDPIWVAEYSEYL